MEGSCLIAISTPLTEANFFTKLITFKDNDGELFFRTLHIGLICKNCLKKTDLVEMMQCQHNKHKLPDWKSGERQERIKIINETFDSAARGMRENYGIAIDSYMGVLPHAEIKKVFSEDPVIHSNYLKSEEPSFLVMCIDPGAGGESETAIVSGYFIHEKHNTNCFTGVIVGIDASKCQGTRHIQQEELILGHISELRKRFRTQRIIVVPENQLGFFESRLAELVLSLPNIIVLHQNGKEKPGVTKTASITRGYVDCLADAFTENAVAFDNGWFTITNTQKKRDNLKKPTEMIKSQLCAELIRFCYDDKGKLTGKINGYTDDKAVAFMMFFYWGRAILNSEIGNPYLNYLPKEAILKFITKQSMRRNIQLNQANNVNQQLLLGFL